MKHLLIVGARGWGREVYGAVKKTPEVINGEMEIKGFLDSKADALDGLIGTFPPIICTPEDYEVLPDDIFFVALGDSHWRKYYAEMIEAKGGHFYTYISPLAEINENATIGEGSFIAAWSSASDNTILGKHVIVHSYVAMGHDAKVGDYATLLTSTFLAGYTQVGCCSTMNPKSMIIPHKKVGNDVSVGAGSVVIKNVKDGLHVMGNPAKKIEF